MAPYIKSVKKKVKKSNADNTIKIGTRTIELSNQDKLFFPQSKITKGDLVTYYAHIAPVMVPYMKNRPISMQRFPQGIAADQEGFFQKDAGSYFPEWITTIPIKKENGDTVNYVIVNNAATLVYLANQACITPHIWLSRTDKLEYPDRMIFDLDPSGKTTFKDIQWIAKEIKKLLKQLHLTSYVTTTGSRGAHVVVPLKRIHTFDYVRDFAFDVACLLSSQYPQKATTDMRKEKRGNRIFIDWLRNGYGATTVAPYGVRAHEGAPVAAPLSWNEFMHISSSQEYTIKDVDILIKKSTNVNGWCTMKHYATSLKTARKKLDIMLKEMV